MADEPVGATPAAPTDPAPATPATPAAVAPDAAAAVPATPAAAAVPAEAPAEKPVEQPAAPVSLLGADGKPADGETPGETPAAAEKPAPSYEAFKLPDGVAADPSTMTGFTELIGKHGLSQEQGQEFVDFGMKWQQALVEHLSSEQHRIWAETNQRWTREVESDPEIGGNRYQTSVNEARTAIGWMFGLRPAGEPQTLEGPALERAQAGRQKFWEAITASGFGNNPEAVRGFVYAYRVMRPLFGEKGKQPDPDGRPAGADAGARPEDKRYPSMTPPKG